MLDVSPTSDKPFFGVVQLSTSLGYKQLFHPEAARHRPDVSYLADILRHTYQGPNNRAKLIIHNELRQEWNKLLEEKHHLLSHYVTQIKNHYQNEMLNWLNFLSKQKKMVDIPWNDPTVWQLIRMVLLFDEGCHFLVCAKKQQLITEQCFSKAYLELVRPIRFCLAKMLRSLEEHHLSFDSNRKNSL
ncbi:hypothetical protein [Spartinivicinus poritis]|uniref:Uncharacterized protein n=1 Tax=Spartinivicinus poritis TaxID=2994640 RepID=A0ABT5UHQ7_9GAMM|nr:hypothetical protein [Spartinivicinus sp. A2-2]MDE1464564.1 hypothetical protein [Spartinivicinus sp. A2-2]